MAQIILTVDDYEKLPGAKRLSFYTNHNARIILTLEEFYELEEGEPPQHTRVCDDARDHPSDTLMGHGYSDAMDSERMREGRAYYNRDRGCWDIEPYGDC